MLANDCGPGEPIACELVRLLALISEKGLRVSISDGEMRCRATKGSLTQEEIASLREHKRGLVSVLSMSREPMPLRSEEIALEPISLAPLTYRQQSLWRLIQRDCSGSSRLVWQAFRLQGPLNVHALRRSVDAVSRRHEALRTTILNVAGIPLQRIAAHPLSSLEITALDDLPEKEDAENEVQHLIWKQVTTPIDLALGPLFQAKLFCLRRDEHVFSVTIHHMVTDADSVKCLFKELSLLYEQFHRGMEPSMPSVRTQCADYAVWQRSSNFQWHEDYWREKLQAAPQIRFPTDPGVATTESMLAAGMAFSFGATLRSALHHLARQESSSVGMVVLAIYASFIEYKCRQHDFVLPYQITGRLYPEHSDMLGFFAHPLALRITLTGEETFSELLRLTTREFLISYQRTDCGKLLETTPHLSNGSMFQWASQENQVSDSTPNLLDLHRLSVTTEDKLMGGDTTGMRERFELDIMISLHDSGHAVDGWVLYRTDLFTAQTVQRGLGELQLLMRFVTQRPHARISEFRHWCYRQTSQIEYTM